MAGSPRSGCLHGQALGKALFQDADCRLRVLSSGSPKRAGELSGGPFTRESTDPIHEGSILMTPLGGDLEEQLEVWEDVAGKRVEWW